MVATPDDFMPKNSPENSSEKPQGSQKRRGKLFTRLRAYFLTGLLIMGPIGITLYIAWVFVKTIDRWVLELLPEAWATQVTEFFTALPFPIPGIGLFVVIIALIIIGAVCAGVVGRYFIGVGERFVDRMPVIRSIYGLLKQVFETVFAQTSTAFREACLIEYPRRGVWVIGFITGRTRGEIQHITEDEMINVFIPTTPNPTSGFLLFVPPDDVVPLRMSVEEAIKLVVSGGIVTPPDRRAAKDQEPLVLKKDRMTNDETRRDKGAKDKGATERADG